MNLTNLTIKEIQNGFKKKNFSATEVTKEYIKNIQKKDKDISAFLTLIDQDLIFSLTKQIDEKILSGESLSVLAGIPVAIKDNILIEGIKCTSASKILENYIAPYDATVVKKIKSLDSVIVGKTNLDEFAMGSSTENSAFFPTRNPYNLECVPGGSSGGSAAAVAGELSVFSLGSDTGGSVRQPASFCGVVGLKPTYGVVSRHGLMAFASSLDQIGPITKTVEDAEIIFDIIKGKDSFDSTSVEIQKKGFNLQLPGIKIGVPKEYFNEKGLDLKVKEIIKEVINKCEKAGAEIIEISLPHTEYALPCYYIIAPSEASANLSRYDGIRYGGFKINEEINNLISYYRHIKGKGFGEEVKRRIMLGTYTLSSGYYDEYYLVAQKVRNLIEKDFKEAFQKVDFIVSPTCPTTAFKIKEKIEDPLVMYYSDIFTVASSLAGLPAISIPCGKIDNLPVGLQIIGDYFEENKIFELGKFIEKL